MSTGAEPIDDVELLYRRIPVSTNWYERSPNTIDPRAFEPHKENDKTGLSFSRARYKSPAEAGRGRPGKSYYVAELCAADIRRAGIRIVPKPLEDDPGHAEAPDLNAENRKESLTLERQRLLTSIVRQVHGPFETPL